MRDAERLTARAASAFVDRASIDWDALLTRARSGPARSVVRNLQLLDSIRPNRAQRNIETVTGPRAVWWVLVGSTLQICCAIVILAGALASGETLRDRADQTLIMGAFCAASAMLGALSRDSRTLALVAWFATVASLFGRSTVHGLPEAWFSSVNFLFHGISLEAFAPACVWQFSMVFPRVERFTRTDVVVARATAACWVLGLVLFVVNLAAAYLSIETTPFAFITRTQPGSAYWELICVALIPALCVVLVRAKRAPYPERRRVFRFALAIAGGTAPILLLGVVLVLGGSAGEWVIDTYPTDVRWPHGMVIGGLAATPILASLAIVIDRPFELRALLRARLGVALGRALLWSAPVAAIALSCRTLYQHRHLTIEQLLSGTASAPLLIYAAIALVLFAARPRLLHAFDRFVSRRAAEHQAQLAHALERIRLARGVREIAAVLGTELSRGTGAAASTVLRATRANRFDALLPGMTSLSGDTALVAILNDTGGPVDVSDDSELRRLLPGRDREWVASTDVALIAPLKHRDEELAAIVALGPKRRGLPFDDRDLWLVATLTTAAAAAWSEADDADGSGAPGVQARGDQTAEAAYECRRCGVVAGAPPLPCACGASPTLAALPARVRDSLIVQRQLGTGGMGVVYLARDVSLDRDVALKTLPRLTPGAVARLRGEAQAMGTLNHESLATIYGFHVWRRTPILIVEYFPRGTLARRLAGGAIPAEDAVALGIALSRGLVYMHARGVLHRDIKPSNIAFTATGTPKLLDFGLAVLTASAAADTATEAARLVVPRAGTRAYLPPEAFDGAPPNVRYDLWALALVLLESVTGVHPFANAHDAGAALDRRWTARAGERGLAVAAPALARVLERALDARPARRFQTAFDLLTALQAI